jgi:hypothetical protein
MALLFKREYSAEIGCSAFSQNSLFTYITYDAITLNI